MKMLRLIWVGLLTSLSTAAQVQTSNGNFYVSYEDLTLTGSEWSVDRSYNSFTTGSNLFGIGWGSNLATRLWPLPDGQLLLSNFGTGRRDLYLPLAFHRAGIYQMIDTIVADEIRRSKLTRSPKDVIRRRSELIADGSMRASKYVDAIHKNNSAPTVALQPVSDKWINEYRESEIILWEGDAYHLSRFKNDVYFDRFGRMIHDQTPSDDVYFRYDPQGKLHTIRRANDSARVVMDEKGHILSISHLDSVGRIREACYQYSPSGLLVTSIDAENNRYVYEYDRNDNMTFTRYSNGAYRRMEYDPATNRTIGFRERNGDSSRYEYGYMFDEEGRLNPDHYYTRITKYDSLGRRSFGTYSEQEYRYRENGENYRYRMYEKTDTSELLYLYPSHVGNIAYAKVDDREAWQQYDAKTRPVYLRILDSVYTTRYNLLGLPERFQAIDSVRRDTVNYLYTYDAAGGLIRAQCDQAIYQIAGSVVSGQMKLSKGINQWTIGFSKKAPSYFIDPLNGRLSISDLQLPVNKPIYSSYQALLKLVIPQKIEHEWVWDRLYD
jgi:YD repeat-containing protein